MKSYVSRLSNKLFEIITSLAKEVMFSVRLVYLSVCLSISNITQKVMTGGSGEG